MSHRQPSSARVPLAALLALLLAATLGTSALAQPRPAPPPHAGTGLIESTLARMSLEEKVGQLFVPYVYGSAVDAPHPSNRSLYGVDTIGEVIDRYHVGGIIYFGWSGNLAEPHAIAELSNGIQERAAAQPSGVPALLSIDQEEGVVVRLPAPSTQLPGTMALGATRDPAHAAAAAEVTARELRAVGINQNFAPVADVNVNALNPVIGVRSFGADPAMVSDLVAAQVAGFQREQVAATAKHFPGHGDTDVDSHVDLPVIEHDREELERIDLPPFRAAIEAGVDAIMTAHIVVPALDPSRRPATLSEPILTGVLREQLGFDGVIVTDALTMAGVRTMFPDERVPVEALLAGADQMLMPPDLGAAIDGVLDAVRSGELTERRIDDSVRRILELKWRRGLFGDTAVDVGAVEAALTDPAHRATSAAIARDSVTLLHDDGDVLPLDADADVLVTGWGQATVTRLAASLRSHGLATAAAVASDPSQARIDAVVREAEGRDAVVVTTQAAGFAPSAAQQALVGALVDTGVPVVAVAVRNPYDVVHHAPTDAALATYGYAPVSLDATAAALAGQGPAGGRLPVDVPEADGTGIRFPIGHGGQP